jgi:hypothetical protein
VLDTGLTHAIAKNMLLLVCISAITFAPFSSQPEYH